jgi:hypothetical protein
MSLFAVNQDWATFRIKLMRCIHFYIISYLVEYRPKGAASNFPIINPLEDNIQEGQEEDGLTFEDGTY